jgi:hypothetical protein
MSRVLSKFSNRSLNNREYKEAYSNELLLTPFLQTPQKTANE